MNSVFKIIWSLVFTLHLLCSSVSHAEERLISESQAKAAFVFKAAHYISWPPPASNALFIGVLGKGPLGREWQNISGKMVNGSKLIVIKSSDIDEMLNCRIVFIEENNQTRLSRILPILRDYPILTIGDSPAFISFGGILNISLLYTRITFSVNLIQARAVGLDISSNLLKLASEVIK